MIKKICHLTSVHPRCDIRIYFKECMSLSKEGYDVSLIVADGKGYEVKNNIKIYDAGSPKNRIERIFKTRKKVFKKALEINADVYHFHDPELIPIGVTLKKKGKKVIYDIHEDVPRQILSKDYIFKPIRKFISVGVELYENHFSKRFDALFTATPFINDRFLKSNKNSVNINNYPIIEEFDNHMKWEDKKREICYVGGIAEIRGIKEIIEAMKYIDGNLNLAGSFETEEMRNEAMNKEGWEKVKYYGFVNREKVREILSVSILGLVILRPVKNYIDSLPIKMFEYMSAGIPVVCSNFPLWKEIIEKNDCGICVNPLNPEEIVKAVDNLLNNLETAKKMGQNGKKAVIEKYNWENEKKKLIEKYKQILNKGEI